MNDPRSQPSVLSIALAGCGMLRHLDSGQLANVRRARSLEQAPPVLWRLVARYPSIRFDLEVWMVYLRICAIFTPKGETGNRPKLHNHSRRLGAVLCDGGNPDWPDTGESRPAISEQRFAQLLKSRSARRHSLLERSARALMRTFQPHSGVDVGDIAWTLLDLNRSETVRQLSSHYYARLDRAESQTQQLAEATHHD